ncbi:MAG: sulfatase-like hydrolase/transferase, partial [Gammaproteobacteria bacterium]|nr:sulfatase-like hydrolase/transferase [Gammaproteobacteria bacterium]
HAPLQGRSDYLELNESKFKSKRRAINAAMTQSMDENLGKVIEKLKNLGLYENTIIIFANDNGGALNKNGSSNAPLRGGKGTVFEGGLKSPFLMQWPKVLSKNQIKNFPISTLDILPTIVSAAGGKLPSDRVYDGVNLLPYLKGDVNKAPHDALFWRVNWSAAVRKENWKLIRTPNNRYLLFDLLKDSREATNLSSSKPEIVSSLKQELEAWEKKLIQPLWEPSAMWKKKVSNKYKYAQ